MMLEADTRLRSLSHGRQSLDSALAALYDCCFDGGKRWRALDLFSQLDQLTGYTIFSDIYHKHVMDYSFPDMDLTYEKLGLLLVDNSIHGFNRITLGWLVPTLSRDFCLACDRMG